MYTEKTYARAWSLLEAKMRAGLPILELDVELALDTAEEFEDQVRERLGTSEEPRSIFARVSGIFRRRRAPQVADRASDRPTSPTLALPRVVDSEKG